MKDSELITRLSQAGVYRDDEARLANGYVAASEGREAQPVRHELPYLPYDEAHLATWQRMISSGDMSKVKIHMLSGVNGNSTPVRWLAKVSETARLIEGFDAHGVKPPSEWRLMTPLHINAAVNNNQPEEGIEKAQGLERVAGAYVARYHPRVAELGIQPQLEIDDPAWVPHLMERGRDLAPHLPKEVVEELMAMASKHAEGDVTPETVAPYIIAHYDAYGRIVKGAYPGGFEERRDAIITVPGSEDTFIRMMEESEGALLKIGLEPIDFSSRNIMVGVSQRHDRPHYYPLNPKEPVLEGMHRREQWVTPDKVRGMNVIAAQRVLSSAEYVEQVIGGKGNIPELLSLVKTNLR